MNIVLANRSYERHMTSEGLQLQNGLAYAGWKLTGPGYDGMNDVRAILHEFKPDHVFVQDKRDWDPSSECPGATSATKFKYLGVLGSRAHGKWHGKVSLVVKDAGPDGMDFHHEFCEVCNPDAVVIYYHPLSVLKYSYYLQSYKLVRTYHSVDLSDIPEFRPGAQRRDACGSGAVLGEVYPLRSRVSARPSEFGLDWLRHPGYQNEKGPATPFYLRFLNNYKVSLATSSSYGFALRKIIEGVACGCAVITDLPQYDVLPEIDRALIRIKPTISDLELKLLIRETVENWDEGGRRLWADRAKAYYDYRAMGTRLSQALLKV